MYKFLLTIIFLTCLTTVSFSQSREPAKTNKDLKPQAIYSESRPYELSKARWRKPRKEKKKKINPKKEAKRKAREEKRRAKAVEKWEKANRKNNAKLMAKNESWLSAEKIGLRDPRFVSIPITIYDKDGKQPLNIGESEIKVFENGVAQKITRFGNSDQSNSIIFLIDVSPSAHFKNKEIRSTLKHIVSGINSNDRIMIVGFDQWRYVFVEPTNDNRRLRKAIKKIRGGSGTSIYDAVNQICSTFVPRIGGRKTVLLFSDGVDTTSHGTDFINSIYELRKSNIALSSIYYNSRRDYVGRGSTGPARGLPIADAILRQILDSVRLSTPLAIRGLGTSVEEYRIGKRYMQELAYASGGRMFNAGVSKDHLRNAFDAAYGAVRSQQYIEYVSNQPQPITGGRRIKVRVNRPNLIVHIRDVYFTK